VSIRAAPADDGSDLPTRCGGQESEETSTGLLTAAKEKNQYQNWQWNLVQEESSSDDADRSKPHPDIFAAALKRLGDVDFRNVLVVGDTPYDVEAAAKLNLRTVGVLCGGFAEQELRDAGSIAIFRDPAHLLAMYDRSPLVRIV
jgi:HAD-hyrolase-like